MVKLRCSSPCWFPFQMLRFRGSWGAVRRDSISVTQQVCMCEATLVLCRRWQQCAVPGREDCFPVFEDTWTCGYSVSTLLAPFSCPPLSHQWYPGTSLHVSAHTAPDGHGEGEGCSLGQKMQRRCWDLQSLDLSFWQ